MDGPRNSQHARLLFIVVLSIATLGTFINSHSVVYSKSAATSQRIIWPVDTKNGPWRIISGYYGGDHANYTTYGIDIARTDGEANTLAETIKSPVSGTIQYDGAARDNIGQCAFILIDGTSDLKIALCHLNFSSDIWDSIDHTKVIRGKHVDQGQTNLGNIAQDTVNGSANTHLHLNIYTEQGTNANTRQAVPFTGDNHIGDCGDFTTDKSWVGAINCGTSSSITINFSVTMLGISNVSGNNNSPKHPSRRADIQVVNSSGNVIKTLQKNTTYNANTGVYNGSITLDNLSLEDFLLQVRLSNALFKQLPQIFNYPSATVTAQTVALISGDINADGQLDILDYNLLLGCYGSKLDTSSCQDKFSSSDLPHNSDLNDDGVVDAVDYNIWLRDTQTQKGD